MPRRKKTEDTPKSPVAGPPIRLSEEVLDKIEDRLLRSMTGEGDALDASTMKEMRTMLVSNGRLVVLMKSGESTEGMNPADEAEFQRVLDECGPGLRVVQ
jgi:hypothetical protein